MKSNYFVRFSYVSGPLARQVIRETSDVFVVDCVVSNREGFQKLRQAIKDEGYNGVTILDFKALGQEIKWPILSAQDTAQMAPPEPYDGTRGVSVGLPEGVSIIKEYMGG